jgi:hypothetical protein
VFVILELTSFALLTAVALVIGTLTLSLFIVVPKLVAMASGTTSVGSGSTSPLSCAHEFPIGSKCKKCQGS